MAKKKEIVLLETKKSFELKKHVAVIHSNNRITLLQRKIANALLFNAYDHLHDREEHEINIGTLCKLIGYDSNDHRTIKKALVALLSTVMEWNLVDGDRIDHEGVWNASSLIADASIDGSLCTYSYSNKMRRLLYRPDMYGRLNMQVQAQFQSSYGLALYENCNRYQDIRQTPWFEIEQFRQLMGVAESKYKIFRDFKTRVLDKAVQEVNQYSPIFVEPQFKRLKRQVVAIQFLIRHSNNAGLLAPPNDEDELADILKTAFGLSKKQIATILLEYEEAYIKAKIELIRTSSSYAAGKIKNLAKYLISALKDDYQVVKASLVPLAAVKPTEERPPPLSLDQLHEYRRYYDKELLLLFDKASEKEQAKILKEFKKHLGRSIYADIYARQGLQNILVRDRLARYISETKKEYSTGIIGYSEWLQNMEGSGKSKKTG